MAEIWQDVRFALRQLRRSPGFAVTAVLTVALSIGIAAAVFSVVDATMLRPMPFAHPERVVLPLTLSDSGYQQPASWPEYLAWKQGLTSFEQLAGYQGGSGNLQVADGAAAPVNVTSGTENLLAVFGVKPLLGRTFAAGEGVSGRGHVLVLGYDTWQRDFGGRKDVVGQTVRLNGEPYVVIGVMPAEFRFPIGLQHALYRPLDVAPSRELGWGSHWLPTVGRLRPGVTVEQAGAEFQHVLDAVGQHESAAKGRTVRLRTYGESSVEDAKGPIKVLGLAVLGVLLIGCTNLAGLLLARGVKRQREFGVRSALGAARGRLLRQMLTETAVLGLAGGVLGVGLAKLLLQLMSKLLVSSLARGADVRVNGLVLLVSTAVAVGTGLVAGMLPAFQSARLQPTDTPRGGSVGAGVSRAQTRLRGGLIVTQVAVALGLLALSAALLHALRGMLAVNLGFDPNHLLVEELDVNAAAYAGRSIPDAVYGPLLERVRALPGVTAAGVINMVPIQDWGSNADLPAEGEPELPNHEEPLAEVRVMLPGAMETLGARLRSGRLLQPTDRQGGQPVVVVNERYVRKLLPAGTRAEGHTIELGDTRFTIVGVVSDVRQNLQLMPSPEVDFAATQMAAEWTALLGDPGWSRMKLVVRTKGDPMAVAPAVRAAMHDVDRTMPFRTPETMHGVVEETLTLERLQSWLFGIFAGLAVLLVMVGLYGTLEHEVELRTREIGVRMALGASRGRVVRGVLGRSAALLGLGVAVGGLLMAALYRVIGSVVQLHGTEELPLLGLLVLGLLALGLGLSAMPARRAASVDPNVALRSE